MKELEEVDPWVRGRFKGPCERRQKPDKVDRRIRKNQTDSVFCGGSFMQENLRGAAKDHFHIRGKYRGPAHRSCNLKLPIRTKSDMIQVFFHSSRSFDTHLIFRQKLEKFGKKPR